MIGNGTGYRKGSFDSVDVVADNVGHMPRFIRGIHIWAAELCDSNATGEMLLFAVLRPLPGAGNWPSGC